jgi:hypothetical protein
MNNNHIEVVGIFSTPIYFNIYSDDIQEVVKFLDSATIRNRSDSKTKAIYGSISEDTYILDRPECSPLKKFILKNLNLLIQKRI